MVLLHQIRLLIQNQHQNQYQSRHQNQHQNQYQSQHQNQHQNQNTTPNWDGVAVELGSADSYRVLLQGQNARDGQAYVWTTNSEGVITKGSGWKSGDALLPLEQEFNIDLNGDGIIA
ncbi:MAG: hypothetical protein O4859_10635 [Trichodesmium sp. St18_bin1]|nr:hypothetical protein [Trichodesmium sp. St18_bin1]